MSDTGMTDDTRRELAVGLAMLVRLVQGGYTCSTANAGTSHVISGRIYYHWAAIHDFTVSARAIDNSTTNPPPLTTGQMLGLSALLGGEVEARVLADWLTEQGADWAEAVAEKARAEGVEQERARAKAERDTLACFAQDRREYIPCPVPGFD